ncbi:MAG TPA: serine hydrolase [Pilimelia sp.]|nr:serine hydrolase [Pilimelia sp.]
MNRSAVAAWCAGVLSTVALAACAPGDRPAGRSPGPPAAGPGRSAAPRVADTPRCAQLATPAPRGFYDRGSQSYADTGDARAAWAAAAPPDAGLDPARLAAAGDWLAARPGARALLVARHGALAYERYFGDASAARSYNVHSASKSILQALVGIAAAQGRLALDAPVSRYLPAQAPPGSPAGAVTVGALLRMSSGLRWREDATEERVAEADDWVGAILRMPAAPGAGFRYSTGNTHVLSAVLQAATGSSTCAFAFTHLFAPLGIAPERWTRDPQGVYAGGYNMYLTARELARFGQLYLSGGRWGGTQLVPADAVVQSRAVTATDVGQPGYGYSAGWWTTTAGGHAVQVAWGYGGQFVCVVPDLDLVVTATQRPRGDGTEQREADIRAFLEHYVLPAVR